MRLIFCADPLQPRRADAAYRAEFTAAGHASISVSLIDFEALVYQNDAAAAVGRVPAADSPTTGIYRGWMLTVPQYALLYAALREREITLINSPEQYAHCHLLPLSYAGIADFTPKTIWIASEDFTPAKLPALLKPFGSHPIIVKDYVKSRKHEWAEACFIPNAADTDSASRVVETFLRRQGSDLSGGLVFREYVEFEPLTTHSQSGMPLTREFRLIFLEGQAAVVSRYWDEGEYAGVTPPLEKFAAIAKTIPSCFFTMDIARTKQGDWMIVELGDAQVAEMPPESDLGAFFALSSGLV